MAPAPRQRGLDRDVRTGRGGRLPARVLQRRRPAPGGDRAVDRVHRTGRGDRLALGPPSAASDATDGGGGGHRRGRPDVRARCVLRGRGRRAGSDVGAAGDGGLRGLLRAVGRWGQRAPADRARRERAGRGCPGPGLGRTARRRHALRLHRWRAVPRRRGAVLAAGPGARRRHRSGGLRRRDPRLAEPRRADGVVRGPARGALRRGVRVAAARSAPARGAAARRGAGARGSHSGQAGRAAPRGLSPLPQRRVVTSCPSLSAESSRIAKTRDYSAWFSVGRGGLSANARPAS
jgi:hypothetical protein